MTVALIGCGAPGRAVGETRIVGIHQYGPRFWQDSTRAGPLVVAEAGLSYLVRGDSVRLDDGTTITTDDLTKRLQSGRGAPSVPYRSR